jgi:hypothetical protein
MFLNWLQLAIFLKSSGRLFHKTAAVYVKEFLVTLRVMALECSKILYRLSPPCLNDLVVLKNSKYSLKYSNIVEIPKVKTTSYGKGRTI